MTDTEKLIQRAIRLNITPEDKERQRRSFAYGNAKTENDRVTKEMVDNAAEKHRKPND